jgi:uncharacterized membrane protein
MENNQEKNHSKKETRLNRLALKTTNWIGSPSSIIIHSIFFVGIFSLQWLGLSFDKIMLILTTVVSLEAIYLAIFIQMTVNRHAHELSEISEEVEDIGEDIGDIQENVEGLEEEMEKDDIEMLEKHQKDQEKILHVEGILKELLVEIRDLKDKKI